MSADIDKQIEAPAITVDRVDHLVEWLEITLGMRLSAFAAGISQKDLARIAHGENRPDDEVERRLRNLFAVASLLASRDGAGSAYTWLIEPNTELEGRAPAELIRDGRSPEAVWFAAVPTY
jgi:hypothetical protein